MRILGFFLCLALMGCATLSPVTLARLSRLDPLESDPNLIAARLTLPPGVAIKPGGAVLAISAQNQDTGARLEGRYPLVGAEGIWRLAPADAAALTVLQSQIQEMKATAPDAVEGTLAVGVEGCRVPPGPAPDARVSVDISLDGGAAFLPLVRNAPLSDLGPGIPLEMCDARFHRQ